MHTRNVKRFFIDRIDTLAHKSSGHEFVIDGKEYSHLKASRYIIASYILVV